MDTKLKNFFNAVSQLSLFNMELHPKMMTDTMNTALNYDFDTAVSLWEFYLEKYESVFVNIKNADKCMTSDVLTLFLLKSEQKTFKVLAENTTLKKYLLTMSLATFNPVLLNFIAQNIATGKTDNADLFLKSMVKHNDFGKIFLEILNLVRQKLLAKQQGNVKLSPKQCQYLSFYAGKIKSEEKPLAIQRTKEIS